MWLELTFYALMMLAGVVCVAVSLVGLPGLWIFLGVAVVYGWVGRWTELSWPGLLAMLLCALLAEMAEFVAGAAGSKAAGGTWRGIVGSIVGGLVGAIAGSAVLPVIGTVVGAVLGAGLGAMMLESVGRQDRMQIRAIGWGAAKGRMWGIVIKGVFGGAMLGVAAVVGWPGS